MTSRCRDPDLNPTLDTEGRCSCKNCKQKATVHVNIVSRVKSGYYCDQCAKDLIWHGIGQESSNFDLLRQCSIKLARVQGEEELEDSNVTKQ